jgi:hypothetical protein
MREQDQRPIWLASVIGNDGSPRASMTSVVLSPLRKQGDVSRILAAPLAVLLQGLGTSPTATLSRTQGSSTSPTATLSHTQGSSTSPTTTLACTQGSDTSLPDTLAHSYTLNCTSGPSPYIYKREVQGLPAGGGGRAGDEQTNRLSLSLATLVTPTTSIPGCEIIHSPLCSILRQPIWAGARSDKIHWSARLRVPGVQNANSWRAR